MNYITFTITYINGEYELYNLYNNLYNWGL